MTNRRAGFVNFAGAANGKKTGVGYFTYPLSESKKRWVVVSNDFGAVDFVVEAATENKALKLQVFKDLDALVRPEVVLATNTSSISITALAASTRLSASAVSRVAAEPTAPARRRNSLRSISVDFMSRLPGYAESSPTRRCRSTRPAVVREVQGAPIGAAIAGSRPRMAAEAARDRAARPRGAS
jgi:hypothetical protein